MRGPGFNLCQPGSTSCGACCGLYNFRHHSRAMLEERLERRTALFSGLERSRDAWSSAARALRTEERGGRQPSLSEPELPCPLLGFLDAERRRIGCLGNPIVTGGIELRDCGNYSAEVCGDFLCDSFERLTVSEAELVRRCCTDWYLYGLVITDPPFVRGALALIGSGASPAATATRLLTNAAAVQALAELLALKQGGVERDGSPQVLGRAPDVEGLAPEALLLTLLGCSADDERARSALRLRIDAVRNALAPA